MGWVFLEVTVALAIAIGIVWWTMPRKPRQGTKAGDAADTDDAPRG